MNEKSFIFYKEWKNTINHLSDEIRLSIYEAVIEYGTTGNIPALENREAAIAFSFIKLAIDRNIQKYSIIAERNRRNGAKGGRKPKNINSEEGSKTQENPDKAYNDNDNDKDNVNDKDNNIKEIPSDEGIKKETNVSSLSPDYINFLSWLTEHAPFCSDGKNFPRQITEAEFIRLKRKYTRKQIASIIEQIENRKDLRKRYSNLYRTVLNWANKEYGK